MYRLARNWDLFQGLEYCYLLDSKHPVAGAQANNVLFSLNMGVVKQVGYKKCNYKFNLPHSRLRTHFISSETAM